MAVPTQRLPPSTLPLADLPAWHARVRPDATALRFDGVAAGYAALHQRSLQWAVWLRAQGVGRGDRIAWLGLNHPDQIALLFAAARVGALLVPLNFRLAPAEWDAVLADCTPRCVIHDAAWADAAQDLAKRHGLPAHGVDAPDGTRAHALAAPAKSASLPVLLVYTSGTTGTPRGAVHTQGNLRANMAMAVQVQRITAADTVATALPLFHVGGLCIQTLPALYAGACVILHARFDAAALLECIARDKPTLTLVVPAVMKALTGHPAWATTDLSSLRAAWAGSSTLPQALVEAFHARGLLVCNVYGATETGPFSIALDERHAVTHAGTCGWPAPGVQARLANEKDGVGEVLLRAPNIVRHYWPDVPAVDAKGWFHSGDLAQVEDDGSWRIVGRAKDMIISGGENIYPAEIENALAAHPDVAECAVVGVADARWGEAVVAAVVPRDGCPLDAQALQGWLGQRVARYKLPRRYVALAALPRTALGKVQKTLLQPLLQQQAS
jgi:fatty-acyl-CoA synthase